MEINERFCDYKNKPNVEAREKIERFVSQIKQFGEFNLTKMQSYLVHCYITETNLKNAEVIGDMHILIRLVKEFLYGTE